MSITSVFGVPLEEHPLKNMELALNSRFFSGVSGSGIPGARRVWQGVRGAELDVSQARRK
jgi:hypothetical protein